MNLTCTSNTQENIEKQHTKTTKHSKKPLHLELTDNLSNPPRNQQVLAKETT
jgi:hypothetical protein